MKIAVIGSSRKENEKRVAIHPVHLEQIDESIRCKLVFEKGYGENFGVDDETIRHLTGNSPQDRKELFKNLKAFLITKPVVQDFMEMPQGALVWGWIHSVSQKEITQIAIEKKMTLIAWENMHYESSRSRIHIFQKNNEIAGYCGVQHALQLRGIDGNYGPKRKVSVLGFGSVGRGAIYALKKHGFDNITVFTQRPIHLIGDKIPSINYLQMVRNDAGKFHINDLGGNTNDLVAELASSDIVVNAVLQNPKQPIVFVEKDEIKQFRKECLIVDISCDEGMGFSFAYPTSFEKPTFNVGNITYYSVDHTPSLLWDSATWEISNCILPYLKDVVDEKEEENNVLNNAIDIRNGIILNKDILICQMRCAEYPYRYLNQNLSQT